ASNNAGKTTNQEIYQTAWEGPRRRPLTRPTHHSIAAANHRRRPQQWQNLFESVVCSRIHTHEPFVPLHALANFFQIGNADGQINFVVYLLAASPKQK